jgi:ABC-type nitrate/sulfonate/bicarbonate transport system ATPase subunit
MQHIWSEQHKTVLFVTHGIAKSVFLRDRVVVLTPRPGRVAAVIDIPFVRFPDPLNCSAPRNSLPSQQKIRKMFDISGATLPSEVKENP